MVQKNQEYRIKHGNNFTITCSIAGQTHTLYSRESRTSVIFLFMCVGHSKVIFDNLRPYHTILDHQRRSKCTLGQKSYLEACKKIFKGILPPLRALRGISLSCFLLQMEKTIFKSSFRYRTTAIGRQF